MSDIKMTKFRKLANDKGYTLDEVGERWGLSYRQMSRISEAGKRRDIDAVKGLPKNGPPIVEKKRVRSVKKK